MNKNNYILKYQYIYILILCFLTNDFFEFTSIKSWVTPEFINYKLYSFNFSILYIPIIVYGVYIYFHNNYNMQTKLFEFLIIVFIKDLVLFLFYNRSFLLSNLSFELYMQFIISFCMIAIIFSYNRSLDDIMNFYESFMKINIFTLLISIFTGIGTGIYGFEKRYHSSNLTHGETGVLFGIFTIYLLCYKKSKYSNLYAVFILVMVLATGSRKDLLYILLVYLIYIVLNFYKIFKTKIKITYKQFLVYYLFIVSVIIFFIFFGDIFIKKLDLERMFSAVFGFFYEGKDFITSDYSGQGRIDSIISAINLLKSNIFGVSFSFFDLQYNMQINNYPTFPHITVLFYYTILGPLILIPIYLYVKLFFNLIKLKNKYIYIVIYFFIYNTASGGALLNFKSLIINIFILWAGMKIVKDSNEIL